MRTIIALAILTVVALFVGCTSDFPDDVTEDLSEEMPEEISDVEDRLEDMEEEQLEEETSESIESTEAFDAFSMHALAFPTYYIKYDVDMGQDMSVIEQWFKGKKMRSDVAVDGQEVRTYMDEEDITSCINQDGWMCFEMSSEEYEPFADAESIAEDADTYALLVSAEPGRTILGIQTECFRIEQDDSWMVTCYAPSHAPLHMEGESNGETWYMTAVDYSTTVADSVFEIPAESTDMSQYMQGYDY